MSTTTQPTGDVRTLTGCYCPGDCTCHDERRPTLCGCTGIHDAYAYVLLTVEQSPWRALPKWPAGPSLVTVDGWHVSYSRRHKDGMVVLRAWHAHKRHELDGTRYAVTPDAEQAAYEAGLLARQVYIRDAFRYGVADLVAEAITAGAIR